MMILFIQIAVTAANDGVDCIAEIVTIYNVYFFLPCVDHDTRCTWVPRRGEWERKAYFTPLITDIHSFTLIVDIYSYLNSVTDCARNEHHLSNNDGATMAHKHTSRNGWLVYIHIYVRVYVWYCWQHIERDICVEENSSIYILYRNNVDKIERNGIKFVLPESKYQMDGVRKNDIEFFKYQSWQRKKFVLLLSKHTMNVKMNFIPSSPKIEL